MARVVQGSSKNSKKRSPNAQKGGNARKNDAPTQTNIRQVKKKVDKPQSKNPATKRIIEAAKEEAAQVKNKQKNKEEFQTTGVKLSTVRKSIDPEKITLSVKRIEPVSAAKVAFFVSFSLGIIFVVAFTLFWLMLDTSGIIAQLTQVIVGSSSGVDMSGSFSVGKVLGISTAIAVIETISFTLLGWLGAVIYNIASSLSGGLRIKFVKA